MTGGVHGKGACMAGGHMCGGGACMAGGHVWWGACVVGGCMHGGGHAWQGACVVGVGWGCAWQIPRDTVNERAVRILLECIFVCNLSN